MEGDGMFFFMKQIHPETDGEQVILEDIARELQLMRLIKTGDFNGISEDKEVVKRYRTAFGRRKNITFGDAPAWMFDVLQKMKGPSYAMKMIGLETNDLVSDVPTWEWNSELGGWQDRYGKEQPFQMFWATFCSSLSNNEEALYSMFVQVYHRNMELAFCTYVGPMLSGIGLSVKEESVILLPFYANVAEYIKRYVRFKEETILHDLETNPDQRIRTMLVENGHVFIEDQMGRPLTISVDNDLLDVINREYINCSAIGCFAQARGTCSLCQKQAYCGEACVQKDAQRHACLIDSQCV